MQHDTVHKQLTKAITEWWSDPEGGGRPGPPRQHIQTLADRLTPLVLGMVAGEAGYPSDESEARGLEALIRDVQAGTLLKAAEDMEAIIANGDVAEVAAPVEGEVGRAAAASKRDQLYEEPVEWIKHRAEELRHG